MLQNRRRTILMGAIILLVAKMIPTEVDAQQHPRYRLIDLGTLGGPHSYGSVTVMVSSFSTTLGK
jgi:hypothetical protein